MPFVLSNLNMHNLSNDIVSTIKQLVENVLLSFITLNAKICELNSNFKNKSTLWTLCYLLIQIWTDLGSRS